MNGKSWVEDRSMSLPMTFSALVTLKGGMWGVKFLRWISLITHTVWPRTTKFSRITRVGGHILGSATLPPQGGRAPAISNIEISLLLMSTSLDTELPKLTCTRNTYEECLLPGGQPWPRPKGAGLQHSHFYGFLVFTRTPFDAELPNLVTNMKRGFVFRGSATPCSKESGVLVLPILGVLLCQWLQP